MKPKVVLIGPIGDYGGRDVEAQLITKALEKDFEVQLLSTGVISSASFALSESTKTSFLSIQKLQFKKSWLLRCTAYLSFLIHKRKQPPYMYVKNKLSLGWYDFRKSAHAFIYKEIDTADVVLFIGQLTSTFLEEVITYCDTVNIPLLVRTTGTIVLHPTYDIGYLSKVTRYIHHSASNAERMPSALQTSYVLIDQAATTEAMLLEIPVLHTTVKKYGFIGRLSKEKGLLELLNMIDLAPDETLHIAGDGPLQEDVQSAIAGYDAITYLGQLSRADLKAFYENVDCVIISSFEESGPLVGLEAMAAGKLIISTDVGAMKDRLEAIDPCFWFDIQQPETFKKQKKMISALQADEVRRISVSLRQRYTSKYTKHLISERYRHIVSEVVS